jgi:hypothetical protein
MIRKAVSAGRSTGHYQSLLKFNYLIVSVVGGRSRKLRGFLAALAVAMLLAATLGFSG